MCVKCRAPQTTAGLPFNLRVDGAFPVGTAAMTSNPPNKSQIKNPNETCLWQIKNVKKDINSEIINHLDVAPRLHGLVCVCVVYIFPTGIATTKVVIKCHTPLIWEASLKLFGEGP